MHTVWIRLNAVIFFGLTVLLGFASLAALSKIWFDLGHSSKYAPKIDVLRLNKLRSLKSHGGVDRALLSFDLHADFSSAFHWNIKQLFVYVVASYKTADKPDNKVVLWDKIIELSDDEKSFRQDNVFVKYALVDQADGLRNQDVELRLMWDHMPLTGMMFMDEQSKATTASFTLPQDYFDSRGKY